MAFLVCSRVGGVTDPQGRISELAWAPRYVSLPHWLVPGAGEAERKLSHRSVVWFRDLGRFCPRSLKMARGRARKGALSIEEGLDAEEVHRELAWNL